MKPPAHRLNRCHDKTAPPFPTKHLHPSARQLLRRGKPAPAVHTLQLVRNSPLAPVEYRAEAVALLRSGAVDGRVLIVMAALASGDRLHEIDVAPPAASAPTANLELGVSEVDSVLQWLDSQIVLRPDRIEVRREASRSYVRLVYSSPEPPGLFPS